MKKRIFAFLMAFIMSFSFVLGVLAAPSSEVDVDAEIAGAFDGDALDYDTTGVSDNVTVFDSKLVSFEVQLDTSSIRNAIKEWYDFGLELLAEVANGDMTFYNTVKQEYDNTYKVTGEFTVYIDMSDNRLIPSDATINGTNMDGFNAEAKELFEEVAPRKYNADKGTLEISIKIKDNENALYGKLASFCDGNNDDNEPLGKLVFTTTGHNAKDIEDRCYITGHLEGYTEFFGSSTKYKVEFKSDYVVGYIIKKYEIDGDVIIHNLDDEYVIHIELVDYSGNVIAADRNPTVDGNKFSYDLIGDAVNGKYDVVVKIYKNDEATVPFETMTKIVNVDGNTHVDEINIVLPEIAVEGPEFNAHDLFVPKWDRPTDQNGTQTSPIHYVPVVGESGTDKSSSETNVARDELKKAYKSNPDSFIPEGETVDIVEFIAERWIEARYKNNLSQMSADDIEALKNTVADAEAKANIDTVYAEHVAIREEVEDEDNDYFNKLTDRFGKNEGEVTPLSVFFELEAFAFDKVSYSNGKSRFIDGNKNLLPNETTEDDATRAIDKTSTVHEFVFVLDELGESDKAFYTNFVGNDELNIFVHRSSAKDETNTDIEVSMLRVLTDRQFASYNEGSFKPVNGTYYVDRTDNTVHIFANEFDTYALTLANTEPPEYVPSTPGETVTRYDVVFNIDGNTTEFKKLTVKKGTVVKVADLPAPEKEGYTFDGWYFDSEMTQKVAEDFKVTKDMVLYGHYSSKVLDDDNHYAYIIGYPDETVRPDRSITRAEATTMFYRLLRDDVRDELFTTENDFKDIESGEWFNSSISTMASAGYVKGRPDGNFDPDAPITRAEFAAIAARIALTGKADTSNVSLSDIEGHWAEQHIIEAAAAGWITGYPDGSFKPDAYITRAEAMTLVNNVLMRHVNEAGLHTNTRFWIDMKGDEWFYYIVLEATNSHEYVRQEDGYNETWTEIIPNKTWK